MANYFPNSDQFPPQFLAVIQTVVALVTRVLYTAESHLNFPETIKRRTLISDINSGADVAMGDYMEYWGKSTPALPFTAYGLGEKPIEESRNTYTAASFRVPIEGLGYASAIPVNTVISMISFFESFRDWHIAHDRLLAFFTPVLKPRVPLVIKGETYYFPIEVRIDNLSKGSYAAAFEEHLRVGAIHDLVHDLRITYWPLVFSGVGSAENPWSLIPGGDEGVQQPSQIIYPVDEITLHWGEITSTGERNRLEAYVAPSPLEVAVTPDTGVVPLDQAITLVFSEGVSPDSVKDAITVNPFRDYWIENDNPAQIYTIHFKNDLLPNTKYVFELRPTVESASGGRLNSIVRWELQT